MEEQLSQVRSADGLADSRQGASDFGLEQNHQRHDTDTGQVAEQPGNASQFPPLGNKPGENEQEAAHNHLHGAGAAEQQEHVVEDDGHEEHVQDVRHSHVDDIEYLKQYHRTSAPPGKV